LKPFSDCLRCGACCHGDEMWIHLVAGDDVVLGDGDVRGLTVLTKHGRGYWARSMKMVDGCCVAHREDLGDGHPGCSVYDRRPEVCRTFEAGSADCQAARGRMGIVD